MHTVYMEKYVIKNLFWKIILDGETLEVSPLQSRWSTECQQL